jgi:Domain of unknown function (DUF4160)
MISIVAYANCPSFGGFTARELNTIESLVEANQDRLLEAWHGYFGDSGR